VIERLTGVHYHAGHVWYILRGLRWSLQRRPARRASETSRPSGSDRVALARGKKKRPAPARLARLRRRKRGLAAARRPAHLGAARPDPGPDPHGAAPGNGSRWLGRWPSAGMGADPLLFPDVVPALYGGDPHPVLRHLKRHFRGHRVILIWMALGATQSVRCAPIWLANATAPRRTPARLCPELNPIEQVWGNVKAREMANVCAPELTALRRLCIPAWPACVANPTSLSPSCGIPDSSSNMTVTLFNETH